MKQSSVFRLLIGLGIVFNVAGCSASAHRFSLPPTSRTDIVTHHTLSNSSYTTPSPLETEGWGVGFVRQEHLNISPFDRPQTEEFSIPMNTAFSPYLIIGQQYSKSTTVLITVLLDYKQVPFTLDGIHGLLHKLTLPPKSDVYLKMEMVIDELGAHDLIIIAFAEPDFHPLEEEQRLTRLNPSLVGRRAVVIVGNDRAGYRKLGTDMLGNPIPEATYDALRVFFAHLPKRRLGAPLADSQLFFETIPPGAFFAFQIVAKNEHLESAEYAIVIFFDFRQVKISNDGVILTKLGPNEESTYKVEMPIPNDKEVHELQAVYVFDPYKSILREEVTAPFVFGSVRAGIQALKKNHK